MLWEQADQIVLLNLSLAGMWLRINGSKNNNVMLQTFNGQ